MNQQLNIHHSQHTTSNEKVYNGVYRKQHILLFNFKIAFRSSLKSTQIDSYVTNNFFFILSNKLEVNLSKTY